MSSRANRRQNTRSLPYSGWDGGVERPPFPLTPDEWAAQNWFSTPPFKWRLGAPESCLWSVTKRMFAMTNKTLRNSLTALAAFAIAVTSVIASSFAAEFTVHQGKRYRATLALKSVERLVDNALIAQKFRDLGFSAVRVSGAGATRRVEGLWPGKDTSANMPPQIIAVAKL